MNGMKKVYTLLKPGENMKTEDKAGYLQEIRAYRGEDLQEIDRLIRLLAVENIKTISMADALEIRGWLLVLREVW